MWQGLEVRKLMGGIADTSGWLHTGNLWLLEMARVGGLRCDRENQKYKWKKKQKKNQEIIFLDLKCLCRLHVKRSSKYFSRCTEKLHNLLMAGFDWNHYIASLKQILTVKVKLWALPGIPMIVEKGMKRKPEKNWGCGSLGRALTQNGFNV